jgi:hypothetical protein
MKIKFYPYPSYRVRYGSDKRPNVFQNENNHNIINNEKDCSNWIDYNIINNEIDKGLWIDFICILTRQVNEFFSYPYSYPII